MKLKIRQKTILILVLYLIIPFIIILSFMSYNLDKIINNKYYNELNEKKQFIINFLNFELNNLQKIFKQLSYSKELISIFSEITVYENNLKAKNELKEFLKNLNFDYIILFTSNKDELIKSKNIELIFPKKFLQNKINLFYSEYKNQFYLIGTTPLYVGNIEKAIYGYITLIQKLDKNYFKKLEYIFNIKNISLSFEKDPKKNLHITLGETITGKSIILNGKVEHNFYEIIKNQNKFLFISLIILIFLFCIITSWLLTKNILKPLKFLENSLDELPSKDIYKQLPNYAKNNEISVIIDKLSNFINKLNSDLHTIWNKLYQEKNEINNFKKNIQVLETNKISIEDKCQEIHDNCDNVNRQVKSIKNINDRFLNNFEKTLLVYNKIIDLSNEVTSTSNVSNVTFKEINRNSEEIKNLLTFITDISSQIDILSVNASIEAIKSGEVGSGFSVVADEIKSLAGTTKEFVENIQKLIENNYNIVKQGMEYSDKINNILKELNEEVSNLFKTLEKFNNDIKTQKEIILSLEDNTNKPDEIKDFIKELMNNIEIVIKELEIKIDNISNLNKESISKIKSYINIKEKNENDN